MRLLLIPVARVTIAPPPYPNAVASAAAHNRSCRSFSTRRRSSNRFRTRRSALVMLWQPGMPGEHFHPTLSCFHYFRAGPKRFNQLDTYVWKRLVSLRVKRKGRQLQPGEWHRWTRQSFHNLGLYQVRGTVEYPEQRSYLEAA